VHEPLQSHPCLDLLAQRKHLTGGDFFQLALAELGQHIMTEDALAHCGRDVCLASVPQYRSRYREELPWSTRLDTDPDTEEISGLDLFGQQADAETPIKYASFSPYACSRMRTK
jgi:hypothetical protein